MFRFSLHFKAELKILQFWQQFRNVARGGKWQLCIRLMETFQSGKLPEMQSLSSAAINRNSQRCTVGKWNENTLFSKVGRSWCGTLRVFYQAAGAGGEVTWWHLSGGKNLISPPGSHIFTLAHTDFYTGFYVGTLHCLINFYTKHSKIDQYLKLGRVTLIWITLHWKVIFDSISNPCNVWYFKICWLSMLICWKVWWSIRPFAFSERHVWEVL